MSDSLQGTLRATRFRVLAVVFSCCGLIIFSLSASFHSVQKLSLPIVIFALPIGAYALYNIMAYLMFWPPQIETQGEPTRYKDLCTVIIPVLRESPERLAKVVKSVCACPGLAEVFIVDNGSDEHLRNMYRKLKGSKVMFLEAAISPLRQFGAVLVAAQQAKTPWVAVVDADYVVSPRFIQVALSQASALSVAAVGYPQIYEDDRRSITRWANGMLSFEFNVENGYRQPCNAHTISGTMIVVRRELFVEHYGKLSSAPYTADFGFALWLHSNGHKMAISALQVGSGLAPLTLYDLAVQQAKWADDLPQYIRYAAAGRLGWSIRRHWHFAYHSTKHAVGAWMVAAAVVLAAMGSPGTAVLFYVSCCALQWGSFSYPQPLRVRDLWIPIVLNPAIAFALCERIIGVIRRTNRLRSATRKCATENRERS